MLIRRTHRTHPSGAGRRASAVVALAAAASLGVLGAASAHPDEASATVAPAVGTTLPESTAASLTTAPDAAAAPATVLDRDDVLALLSRADDYLTGHPADANGPVAQAAGEVGMLLVSYDAQVAATAALTPPVDMPVSALKPPDPMTTSPWDRAVGSGAGTAGAPAGTAPAGTPAPSPTASSTSAPWSTATPSATPTPSPGASAGTVLEAGGIAPNDVLPTTGATPGIVGDGTDVLAAGTDLTGVDPGTGDSGTGDSGTGDSGTEGSGTEGSGTGDPAPSSDPAWPQADPTSPAGTVGTEDGTAGGFDGQTTVPDPEATAGAPTSDPSTPAASPAPVVPSVSPSAVPTPVTPAVPTVPAVPSGSTTTAPTDQPTAVVPTSPAGTGTSSAGTTGTTGSAGSAAQGATTPAPGTSGTTGTSGTMPSATAGSGATGVTGSGSAGAASSGGTTLPDPDAQDGTAPVTWADVVAAAERLATALDTVEATDSNGTDGASTGPDGDTSGALTGPLTGSLADQLQTLVGRYGTSIDGYKNGRIPASALCPLSFAPGQMLRCDAANRLEALDKLFEKQFGHPIPMTDSYRPLAVQIELRRTKPGLAAVPGTSNHGWGLAVDLGYPISTGRSAEYAWMREHGPSYGWDNPSWAHLDGSKPEPWHFEFYSGGVLPTGTPVAGYDGVIAPVDDAGTPDAPSTHASTPAVDPSAPKTSKPTANPTPRPTPTATTVTVPDGLVGKSLAVVQKKLVGLGLKVADPAEQYSDTVTKGSVVSLKPGGGSSVKAGSTVELVVSLGEKPAATTVTIPDGLAGQSPAGVQKKLEALGLKVVVDPTKVYSDAAAGSVASTTPSQGASVKTGSTVKLVVSRGPKPPAEVTIPDGLVGQTLAGVQAKLEARGLKVVVDPTKVYSDTAAGSVVSLTPGEETSVKVGSTVELVVSLGPKPEQTTVPEGLVGQPAADAEQAVTDAGLKADVEQEPSDTVPDGTVIRVDPDEGATVDEGSTVTIVVSTGPGSDGGTPTPTATPEVGRENESA